MNTLKFLLGAMAGMIAGVTIGVLFAPEKGERTRKKILRKGDDLKDFISEKVEDKFDQMSDSMKEKIRKAKVNI